MHPLVGGPVRFRNLFLAREDLKKHNFLRCIGVFDLLLKYCFDIKEENWP